MNLKDIRLAKKLGNKFFEFSDELIETQKKFRNFKQVNLIRVRETQEIEDIEEAISVFNKEIRAFWVNVFCFKSSYNVNSGICKIIAIEKIGSPKAESIASKLAIDNSIEDVLTLVSCLTHYEILSEFYFSQHLDKLGEAEYNLFADYLLQNRIEEITTPVLKTYLGTKVAESLQTQIVLHFYQLIEQAWEYAKKNSLGPFSDEDFLKYTRILTQVLTKRSIETSDEHSQDILDFIKASFNPISA
ncbi:MAG: hypothetical protein RLY76_55 [Actinomycetota bacterium]|jgi:hypothetical protein